MSCTTKKRPLLETLKRSQAAFTQRYVGTHPERRSEVNERIRSQPHASRGTSSPGTQPTLWCAGVFPPYSDPSAVTVAKRIAQEGNVADVLCCDMSAVESFGSGRTVRRCSVRS